MAAVFPKKMRSRNAFFLACIKNKICNTANHFAELESNFTFTPDNLLSVTLQHLLPTENNDL